MGQKIAVLGFGSQGHAHAQNLQDSGHDVRVGLREGSARGRGSRRRACRSADRRGGRRGRRGDGRPARHAHGAVYATDIAPNLSPGNMLMFAHGFSIHFGTVKPPADVDVTMIAPKVRATWCDAPTRRGSGPPHWSPCSRTRPARPCRARWPTARGSARPRAGIIQTTFKEETETDLFGEQSVLCGGISTLVEAGFETLVNAGYQPEIAYFECLHELKLIIDLIYEGGLSWMRYSISTPPSGATT
jgi:ketol-acid reductoisomerase